MTLPTETNPLISVIIPCFNYGVYLGQAIQSVLNQSWNNVEIIVIDDGSSDNTREVVMQFANVNYHYQANRGLPASRNHGVKISHGSFIVFLDADDWLYPNALETNFEILKEDASVQFVSGAYNVIYADSGKVMECKTYIKETPYLQFLGRNYVGVPGAVMYRRSILDEFNFDEKLKSCEDYDLYLKIASKYKVMHHNAIVAAYRKHGANMSSNFSVMLATALNVLHRQKENLKTTEEKQAYRQGVIFWKKYYTRKLYEGFLSGKVKLSKHHFAFLLKSDVRLFLKTLAKHFSKNKKQAS